MLKRRLRREWKKFCRGLERDLSKLYKLREHRLPLGKKIKYFLLYHALVVKIKEDRAVSPDQDLQARERVKDEESFPPNPYLRKFCDQDLTSAAPFVVHLKKQLAARLLTVPSNPVDLQPDRGSKPTTLIQAHLGDICSSFPRNVLKKLPREEAQLVLNKEGWMSPVSTMWSREEQEDDFGAVKSFFALKCFPHMIF